MSRSVVGKVVSSKMNKTVSVEVSRRIRHLATGKYVTRSTKYLVHDEQQRAKEGDVVEISASRPISKLKRWVLVDVKE